MKRGELSSLRAEVAKLRAMVVYLAEAAASEYDGTGSRSADPQFWIDNAKAATEKSLAKKAAEHPLLRTPTPGQDMTKVLFPCSK